MKKISRSSELLWLFGMIFVAFGVAICSKARRINDRRARIRNPGSGVKGMAGF